MNNSQEIAERIRKIAKQQGKSITEMLKYCGLSKNALSSMQAGNLPRIENLAKIADYLGTSIDYLLGRSAGPGMPCLEKLCASLAALIAAAEAEPQPIDYQERIVTFSETLEAMRNPDAPASATNELLKSCIRRITYSRSRGKRIHGAKGGWTVNPIRAEIELIL